jgi:hypothetical protein
MCWHAPSKLLMQTHNFTGGVRVLSRRIDKFYSINKQIELWWIQHLGYSQMEEGTVAALAPPSAGLVSCGSVRRGQTQ